VSEGDEEGLRVVVHGRVQGVGFRAWTRRRARELKLRGWVVNRPDGAVELHVAGTRAHLEVLRGELETGPPAARVEEVTEEGEPIELPSIGFEIRRYRRGSG
jgi:acylphosphatase